MNLLPPHAKEVLSQTIRARFLLTGSLIIGGAALIGILALIPALYVAGLPQAELSREQAQVSSTSESTQAKTDRESITHARTLLVELAALSQSKKSASDTIAGIYALRPSGVIISNVVYAAGKVGTIALSGNAPNRDVINAYRTALSESGHFDSVSVPVAALVGALEGRFTITLTGAF